MQSEENNEMERTLFRFPGPVLIMVYKLSPELFESGKGAIIHIIGTGWCMERVMINSLGQGSTNLQGWAWWEFLEVPHPQKHPMENK